MSKSNHNLIATCIRFLLGCVIVFGAVMILVMNVELGELQPEHYRLKQMVGKLPLQDKKLVHISLLSDRAENVWKWRMHIPNGSSYLVFTCAGQISEDGAYRDFSTALSSDVPVTTASRPLHCHEMERFRVADIGHFITHSFDFDSQGSRWYTKTAFEDTLNQYPKAFAFLTDPEKRVVMATGEGAMVVRESDEIIPLFRIRSRDVSRTKEIDGKEIKLYHGIYTYLVPAKLAPEFRESSE